MSWHRPAVCLLASLLVAGLAWPLAGTLVQQVGEIVPAGGEFLRREPYRAAAGVLWRDPGVRAVHQAFQRLAADPPKRPDTAELKALDPPNGLYSYLELYPTSAGEPDLAPRLADLVRASPARLYLKSQYARAREVFVRAQLPPRLAARAAQRMSAFVPGLLAEPYGPVLRAWSGAMLARGQAWRDAGRPADALNAHAAVARLLYELAEDSPVPAAVLPVCDILPTALEALARDCEAPAGAAGPAPGDDLARDLREQAARVRAVPAAWHRLADADGLNVLPYTGLSYHVKLAVPQHERALAGLCFALPCLATWSVLLLVCAVCLVLAGLLKPDAGVEVVWRQRHGAWWRIPLIVCGPVVVLGTILHAGRVDYSWLISLPSLRAVVLWPAVVVVLTGLAVRACLSGPGRDAVGRGVGRGLVAGVLLAAAVVVAILWPASRQAGAPPVDVQVFRHAGLVLGVAALVVLLWWAAGAAVRAGRGVFRAAAWSRAYLNAASVALLGMTLIGSGALWLNREADLRHERAFVRAAADPLGDRLGPTWFADHVAGVRLLLERVEAGRGQGVATRPAA